MARVGRVCCWPLTQQEVTGVLTCTSRQEMLLMADGAFGLPAGDQVVSWANASLRRKEELPHISYEGEASCHIW